MSVGFEFDKWQVEEVNWVGGRFPVVQITPNEGERFSTDVSYLPIPPPRLSGFRAYIAGMKPADAGALEAGDVSVWNKYVRPVEDKENDFEFVNCRVSLDTDAYKKLMLNGLLKVRPRLTSSPYR